MPAIPWRISVHDHPGSSSSELKDEPEWGVGHQHRVGYKNKQDRRPGLTHAQDESDEDDETAQEHFQDLKDDAKDGKLTNFRNLVSQQKDYHLLNSENRPLGWRFVLDASEDWVKNQEEWPANIEKKKKKKKDQDEKQQDQQQANGDSQEDHKDHEPQPEHEWKKGEGENKHHDAYAGAKDEKEDSHSQPNGDQKEHKTEYQKLREKYTPQEIALLRSLQHEKNYIKSLEQNDGKQTSPQKHNRTETSIDEQDQFSPDNWLPRSSDLIRLTGKHPLNAEAHLSHLFDAGLVTPNELHYVRNHGAVPRLIWEEHRIDIQNGKVSLSMEQLKNEFESINIQVALACDGNRRKELNMIKRSKGFNWGAGATGCAFWKGPLLRDVLQFCGLPEHDLPESHRYWVHFEGADQPSEGPYQTSIPFPYAMDPTNDVILAHEMNDVPLPPDHGYPVRLMIPGYVGGRCIKWVHKIWISDKENDSYYHIWDNRVLPSFITEKDGEFAEVGFNHPDTACNEQNLNSVIVHPQQGERIALTEAKTGNTYRIKGYAYDGGGHEVQRVEVSLDEGKTWLYCIREFPGYPIRHGTKFWTWLHWYIDVEISHMLRASSISVRCFNVFKNTQPKEPSWNLMGMMNNCWYVVKPEIVAGDDKDKLASILFRHPVEPGTADGGWMRPSVENQIAQVKQQAGTPQKRFTRQEIEKHDKEDDCWIVIDGKVYDATSVLAWHPGGKAAITAHAGFVHQETSNEFASIHDGFAYQKLKDCALGIVSDKAMQYIKKNAEAAAKDAANNANKDTHVSLEKHRWVPVKLIDRKSISEDTRTYTFHLPDSATLLGLGTCQHVQLGFHMLDRMLIRSYTPTRPLLPLPSSADEKTGIDDKNHTSQHDGGGTFDLTVKTYFPTSSQPGGAMSNILDTLPLGEEIEIRGPTGEIVYNGNGRFVIEGQERTFRKVSLVLGGSGITPGYALIARVLLTDGDDTQIRVVDANKTETDILLKESLDGFEKDGKGQLEVCHVLSHPSDGWEGKKGHVDEGIIKEALFPPEDGAVVFLCGPPGMIQKAALPALRGEFLCCDGVGNVLMLCRLGIQGGREYVWVLGCRRKFAWSGFVVGFFGKFCDTLSDCIASLEIWEIYNTLVVGY